MSMLKIRQQIALNKFKLEMKTALIEKIMKVLPIIIEKYKLKLNSKYSEELSRRISVLNTRKFVIHCVEIGYETFHQLGFSASSAEVLTQVKKIMIRDIAIIPDFEPMKCVLVRQRLTKFALQLLTDIKNEQLKSIRNERARIKCICDDVIPSFQDDSDSEHVKFAESTCDNSMEKRLPRLSKIRERMV